MSRAALIQQQPDGPVVVRDEDVDVAVVVDVAERRAAADVRAANAGPPLARLSNRRPRLRNSWFRIR